MLSIIHRFCTCSWRGSFHVLGFPWFSVSSLLIMLLLIPAISQVIPVASVLCSRSFFEVKMSFISVALLSVFLGAPFSPILRHLTSWCFLVCLEGICGTSILVNRPVFLYLDLGSQVVCFSFVDFLWFLLSPLLGCFLVDLFDCRSVTAVDHLFLSCYD